MSNYVTVEFEGKVYTLTSDADFTNRLLPSCNTNYHEVEDGEEYDFEMSAPAIDIDGEKYTVYWIFTDTKGEEWDSDKFDYDDVNRIEVD